MKSSKPLFFLLLLFSCLCLLVCSACASGVEEDEDGGVWDFNNNTYGITVHWHDPVTGELLNGAHLLTVCGIIVNDEAESLEDRYVGILIVDSDDTIVHPDVVPTAPWERPRAAIASNVIDIATLYHLKLVDIPGQGPTWTIVGYNDNITTLDFLWKLPYLQ